MINISKHISVLKGFDLFEAIKKEDLQSFFTKYCYKLKSYAQGAIIHLQNEKCTTVDIIIQGKLSVQKIDKAGNVLIVEDFTSGAVLGANLIFGGNNYYPLTVIAEQQVLLLHLSKRFILELCKKDENFLLAFLKIISNRMQILAGTIKKISYQTIRNQIISYLNYEYYLQKNVTIKLRYSKKELAQRFGVARSSLSRELNKMRQEGLVEYDAKTITIKKNPLK